MLELVIVSIIVISIMMIFVFFVFKNIIKRINKNTKKYFMDKLQDYDYIIDEKKQELEKIEKQIEEKKKQEEYTEEDFIPYKTDLEEKNAKEERKEELVYDIPTAEYRQDAFFKNYKNLKKEFNIKSEKVIKEFIEKKVTKNNTAEQKEYEILDKFRKYFDSKTTYECMTLTHEEQYQVIDDIAKKKEKQVFKWENYQKENFEITKFLEEIDERLKTIDPTIYVYVSDEGISYEYLDEHIKMLVYQNMSEGIIIKYRDKTYDYSI